MQTFNAECVLVRSESLKKMLSHIRALHNSENAAVYRSPGNVHNRYIIVSTALMQHFNRHSIQINKFVLFSIYT